jgi:hypothetical protein
MNRTASTTARTERLGAALFADRPARIRRPQTAKWEPRVEGTPEEAREAAALIRARQRAS